MNPDNDEVTEGLRNNKLLKGLDLAQVQTFRNAGHLAAMSPQDIVLHQGDVNSHVYLVLSGELDVYLPAPNDPSTGINLASYQAGDYFGEYAYLDPAPASASVRATKLAVLLRVAHAAVDELLDSDPAMGRIVYKNLLVNLVVRLRETNEELDLFRPFS